MHPGHQPPGHLFLQKRVGDGLPLALLPLLQKGPPSPVGEEHRAAFPKGKILRLQHAVVDKRQHKPVGQAGPQLLHQVQGQRLPPRAVPVKIAHIGVQPHAFQRRSAVVGQETVGKGPQGVEGIQGRTAAALPEKEGLFPVFAGPTLSQPHVQSEKRSFPP